MLFIFIPVFTISLASKRELGFVLSTPFAIRCCIFHPARWTPISKIVYYESANSGPCFSSVLLLRLWKHSAAHGICSRSQKSRLYPESPMRTTSPSPPPSPPRHHSEARTTSARFSVISTPLDQNSGTIFNI